MLYADKQQLQRQLEVDLLNLRQKELNHFTTCCLTLSAPAALIAGFAYTGIAEVAVPDETPWFVEGLYYTLTVLAMLFEIAATVRSSLVALVGPALALRGKAGSMHRSVEAMEPCFREAWRWFLLGMLFWLLSTLVNVFQQAQHWGIATFVGFVILVAAGLIFRDIRDMGVLFNLPVNQVEKGAFSRSEVESMFREGNVGRRTSRGEAVRRSRLSQVVTSRNLIAAAEGGTQLVRERFFSKQHTRDGKGGGGRARSASPRPKKTAAERANMPVVVIEGPPVASPAADVAGTPADQPSALPAEGLPQARGSVRKSFADEFRAAKSETQVVESCSRTVHFEMDKTSPLGPSPVAPSPAAQSVPGFSPTAEEYVEGKRRGKMLRIGESGGYLPCVSPSKDAAPSNGRNHAHGMVNVVCTLRGGGKRLRWKVPMDTTIAALRPMAEAYFETVSACPGRNAGWP
mmetsp:Transcript_886/g.2762  ORF Transcript_886/g.2762 Transcript_886/m.2762 type:complete len:459 (+) Transcript_886:90-1466(+)